LVSEERERLFNAPWQAIALVSILVVCFVLQSIAGVDAMEDRFGFAPRDIPAGVWQPLVTSIFLHGGWLHLLANSAFGLAFATPVARRMGEDPAGGVVFFLFFVVCGVLANLGFALVDPLDRAPLVGASGALSGMMGATSRLMTPERKLAGFTSPPVIGMTASWIGVNLIIAFVPLATPGAGHVIVAWQAHVAGYLAGLLLIAPTLRLLGQA
jgi:membrane associated rhomboid family serine protease